MSRLFEDMMPHEYKAMMKKLNKKLKIPPTEAQRRYFEFANRHKGYQFMELRSGIVFTKFELWQRHSSNHRKVAGVLYGTDILYKSMLKLDWHIVNGEAVPRHIPRKRSDQQ